MGRTLFRQEAIEFQQRYRQWGEATLPQPLSTKAMVWFVVSLVVLIVIFMSLAQYSRKETVVGYLTPTSGTAKIFAPQQGYIKEVDVKEGQQVGAGEPLLAIETAQITADGEDVNATILNTLTLHRGLLAGQIATEEDRTKSERERLTALIRGFETEINSLHAQMAMQSERERLSQSFVSSAAQLRSKGVTSDAEFKRREAEFLEQKQRLSALGQQLVARQNQLNEARYSLEQLAAVMAERTQLMRYQFATTEQRIAEINGRRAYILRAPTTGHVSMLQAAAGQTADPKRLLLEIIPSDSVLQAELFVPTRAAGFVQVGQKVRLLYDAFPYQKFGTYTGSIIKVSHTVLTSSDISGPVALKEPAYTVSAALDRPDVDAYGQKMPLQADMLLKADIILDRRSLMSWLVDPLLSARM